MTKFKYFVYNYKRADEHYSGLSALIRKHPNGRYSILQSGGGSDREYLWRAFNDKTKHLNLDPITPEEYLKLLVGDNIIIDEDTSDYASVIQEIIKNEFYSELLDNQTTT